MPTREIALPSRSFGRVSVAWAPNDQYLAVSQTGGTQVFPRREDGTLDKAIDGPGGQTVAWSKNSKLAVARPGSNAITVEVCESVSSCRDAVKRFSLTQPGIDWNTKLSLSWSGDGEGFAVTVGTKDYVER